MIKKAETGEDVIICRAGKPVVRVTRYNMNPNAGKPCKLGLGKGQIIISPDFDDELPDDFLKAFKEGV